MTRDQQERLRAVLAATLLDGRLSRAEGKALRAVMKEIADEGEALAFSRNTAFDLAAERIEASPRETLNWLQRVDKIIDNARRGPTVTRDSESEACFSPGNDVLELIRRTLHNAEEAVEVCVFTVTDDRITDALLEAHGDGVSVRVVTDNDKQHDRGSDIVRLVEAGVPVRFDPTDDHMHHKFAIVDGHTLLVGSYNWTRGATRNHESLIATREKGIVERFGKEFEAIWDRFG